MRNLPSALLGVVALVLSGCAADDSGGSGGSCPLALEYDGDTYYALKTEKPVHGDGPLGSVGFSACVTDADDKAAKELISRDPGPARCVIPPRTGAGEARTD